MEFYYMDEYDVAVIGAGHAGIEAALAASRLGVKTAIFTMSLDAIGNMPCNPSIGGTAKGHLVREIDALGGEMGKAADATFIQSRMLNRGKGPAVHSLRVQNDRERYHVEMKRRLENQKDLDIIQAEIVDLQTEDGKVTGIVTALGSVYKVKAAIICSGTFLNGKIYVGDRCIESGPDGLHAAKGLSEALVQLGLPLRRFKTGTPALSTTMCWKCRKAILQSYHSLLKLHERVLRIRWYATLHTPMKRLMKSFAQISIVPRCMAA